MGLLEKNIVNLRNLYQERNDLVENAEFIDQFMDDNVPISDMVCVFPNMHLSESAKVTCDNNNNSILSIFTFSFITIILLFITSYILLICISSCISYKKKSERESET